MNQLFSMSHNVRDEGVACSNHATPTITSRNSAKRAPQPLPQALPWDGFAYDPNTGVITRWRRPVGRAYASGTSPRYVRFKYAGRLWLAHRVAWFLHYGEWPDRDIDHIDGDRSNNRLANLRAATRSQNMANVGPLSTNTSGFRGVSRDTSADRQRWRACVTVRGRNRDLGAYDTPEDAARAYDACVAEIHGEFAWTNFPRALE